MNGRQSLLEQIVLLREEVLSVSKEIRSLRFPSDSPRSLTVVIDGLVERVSAGVLAAQQDTSIEDEDFDERLRFAIQGLRRLGAHLRYAERAALPRVLPGSARALIRLAHSLFSGARFILRPQWTFNYSQRELVSDYRGIFADEESGLISPPAFEEIVSSDEAKASDGIYVLSFPRIEKENVLFHVALGHELGHPIASAFLSRPVARDFLANVVSAAARASAADLGLDNREIGELQISEEYDLAVAATDAQVLAERALEELIADLVCLHIFGYAALAYTARMGLIHGMDKTRRIPAHEHYPPWRYRLRTMMRAIPDGWFERFSNEGNFPDVPRRIIEKSWRKFESIVENESDIQGLGNVRALKVAYGAVDAMIPTIQNHVESTLNDVGISILDMPGKVHWDLVVKLLLGFPPDSYTINNDTGLPPEQCVAGARSIENVAWVARDLTMEVEDMLTAAEEKAQTVLTEQDFEQSNIESGQLPRGFLEKVILGFPYEQFTVEDGAFPSEVVARVREHVTIEWIMNELNKTDEASEAYTGSDSGESVLHKKLRLQERLTAKALEYSDLWVAWLKAQDQSDCEETNADSD